MSAAQVCPLLLDKDTEFSASLNRLRAQYALGAVIGRQRPRKGYVRKLIAHRKLDLPHRSRKTRG